MCGRKGYISTAIAGAHVWGRRRHHPCRVPGPCLGVTSTSHMPSRGPMCGWNGYITPAVSAGHVWAEWLHHPYRVPGPCVGGMATSHMPSRGPMCGLNAYITPAVSGAPCGRNGYITSAVLGAHVWAEWLPQPRRLGGPGLGGLATSLGVVGAPPARLATAWVGSGRLR